MVVCCRDRPELLRDALSAIRTATRPTDEVIVVDSASASGAVRDVAAALGAHIVRCDEPGLSRARNAGWRAASGGVVAFTDDDCRPRPGWAAAVVAAFGPDVGFVTGRLVSDDGGGPPLSVLDVDEGYEVADPDASVRIGTGGNMAFRREVLEAISGFDEHLGAGAEFDASEEVDAFWRVLRLGWRGRYVPDAEVVHRQWKGRVASLRTEYGYGRGEGAMWVKRRRSGSRPEVPPWRASLARAVTDLRAGYEWGVVVCLVRAAGSVAGRISAGRYRVEDGRFVA